MADPMRIRANNKDGVTEVRVLMSHVMESGARKDAAGVFAPAANHRTADARTCDLSVEAASNAARALARTADDTLPDLHGAESSRSEDSASQRTIA